MLKPLMIFALTLMGTGIGIGQPIFDTDKGQRQEIGDIYPSPKPYLHEFKVYNRGDYDLEIYSTHAHCGCTTVLISDSVIAPGDSALMRFALKTQRMNYGEGSTAINIFTNDPDLPDFAVDLNYNLIPVIIADYPGINFGRVDKGETKASEYTFKNKTDKTFTIKKIDFKNPRIGMDLRVGDTIAPLSETKVIFTYRGDKEEFVDDDVILTFDNPIAQPLSIHMDGLSTGRNPEQ